ncbi:WhiB family transcriptional regulator [Streptomyces sp. NPDC060064]|uniref:WhiB family transcriptional regulator n=1 Tax=Streptomyces sp. NPDC060064 TaxID=3347049 RepID=UPI0036C4D681
MSRYEWMADAACARVDPDLWFPEAGQNYRTAKQVCAACPVQRQCNDQAQRLEGDVSHPYRHGTWAGAEPRTRAKQAAGHAKAQRNADILRLAAKGWDAEAIAAQLEISDRTVWRVLEAHRNRTTTAA